MDEKWSEYIRKAKADYEKVGFVYCPALKSNVYFDNVGWDHLLFKHGKRRKIPDAYRKLSLWIYAPNILKKSESFNKYTPEFWEFTKMFKERTITVIVRKIGDGSIHFFSIKDTK